MKIRGEKLKKIAAKQEIGVDDLAGRMRDGLGVSAESARSAILNWMDNRNHPRAKPQHIATLAGALGVEPKDIVRFTSEVRFQRGSPKKVKLLADLIRGKPVDVAENLLTFTTKRAAVNMKKALVAARSDAEQAGADVTRLVVSESRVDAGPQLKRFQPKDRGRAHSILKRSSHITVGVEER